MCAGNAKSVADGVCKGTGWYTLPTVRSGVRVSRPGVLVTAFGVDPNENAGTLLHIWEQTGISGKQTVTLPEGMEVSSALPVNLRGEKIGEAIPV